MTIKDSTTDGDAERSILCPCCGEHFIDVPVNALPPVPVDTIAVPREVLQGVREALKFYARHEHWMAFDDTDPMRRVLTAMKNSKAGNQDGWEQAEEALASLDAVLGEGK